MPLKQGIFLCIDTDAVLSKLRDLRRAREESFFRVSPFPPVTMSTMKSTCFCEG